MTDDLAVQFDIFGAEHVPNLPQPANCRPDGRFEQPRLFEPQYEGQLALADNPETPPDGGRK